MTACHYAARNGHLEVVKLLIAHGANRQLRNEVDIAITIVLARVFLIVSLPAGREYTNRGSTAIWQTFCCGLSRECW